MIVRLNKHWKRLQTSILRDFQHPVGKSPEQSQLNSELYWAGDWRDLPGCPPAWDGVRRKTERLTNAHPVITPKTCGRGWQGCGQSQLLQKNVWETQTKQLWNYSPHRRTLFFLLKTEARSSDLASSFFMLLSVLKQLLYSHFWVFKQRLTCINYASRILW